MSRQRDWKAFVKGVAVCAAYVVAAKLSLRLASVHPSATPVWPPTGIGIATLVALGLRFWPSIFIGAFLVNLTTAGSVLTSVGIATGNTLEALLASFLVVRFANGRHVFEKTWDIVRFALYGGVLSTAVAATFGVTSLAHGHRGDSLWGLLPRANERRSLDVSLHAVSRLDCLSIRPARILSRHLPAFGNRRRRNGTWEGALRPGNAKRFASSPANFP